MKIIFFARYNGDLGTNAVLGTYLSSSAQWAKTWKKSILAGQCTVCLKGLNQRFLKIFQWSIPKRGSEVKKKFQKTLILVFEEIVQQPKVSCQNRIFPRVLAHCDSGGLLCESPSKVKTILCVYGCANLNFFFYLQKIFPQNLNCLDSK